MKNLSNSKAVKNLLAVLKAKESNLWGIRQYYEDKGDHIRAEKYLGEIVSISSVIMMIEDKEHFEHIASVYDVELIK